MTDEEYKTHFSMWAAMKSPLNHKIFERSFAYFSKDLKNVKRDWEKVTRYGKRLGVLSPDFAPNYTNNYLDWQLSGESSDPMGDQRKMAQLQKDVAAKGGFHRLGEAVKGTAVQG